MRTVYFDCGGLPRPTAATLDQLARLKLAAKRNDCELELRNAGPDLTELICFAGLAEALGLESEGQPEQRKQPLRVEEEGQLDDLSPL
jgi:hypothetical protein